ncbi:hypothetical protein [Cellulomonas hominis]|uniref:hypothetical protein n=1 Tax=Cellulomonas hominis TaxID=156981 RepID=UPI001BA02458|nr:hypothetical protein [Cellulomonas hominis]VTR76028.1 hypothetical protein CHMI_00784 [Cellulomonas hominis]
MKTTGAAVAGLMMAGTGALALAPAASAQTQIAADTISLDPNCPTAKFDTSSDDCTWLELSSTDFLLAGVPDAVHDAITFTVTKDGAQVATGDLSVPYAKAGGKMYLTGATAGHYRVELTAPAGFKQTGVYSLDTSRGVLAEPGGTAVVEFDLTKAGGSIVSRTISARITSEATPLAPVQMYAWLDTNLNGAVDAGEGSPEDAVTLELRNQDRPSDGLVPLSAFGPMDPGVRTYWVVPGTYDVTFKPYAYGSQDLVPLGGGIDPTALTGILTVPATGTSLMVPVGPSGATITPNPGPVDPDPEPTEPTNPDPEPTDPAVTAPVVTQVSGPAASTTDRSAAFEFSTDQDVTWSYALDGVDLPFTGTTLQMADLSVGEHTLVALATNGEGRTTTHAVTWTVLAQDAPVAPGTIPVAGPAQGAGTPVAVEPVAADNGPSQLATTGVTVGVAFAAASALVAGGVAAVAIKRRRATADTGVPTDPSVG